MRNWTIDVSQFDKKSPEYEIWRLEQLINFGLNKDKISKESLQKNLEKLHLDPSKKKYMKFLLSHA
jgi:hypothetical protein